MNYNFVDAQQMSKDFPDTFEAPSAEDLASIVVGSIVKVSCNDERFWTVVTEVDGDNITAEVDNDLIMEANEELTYKSVVKFEKKNIYSIF